MLVEQDSQGKEDFQHYNHLGGRGEPAILPPGAP